MSISKPETGKLPRGLLAEQLRPDLVFYELVIPMLYVTRTVQGQELLAYVADITDDGVFTVLVPMLPRTMDELQRGSLSVRQALFQAPAMLHWTDGTETEAWVCDLSSLSPSHLPAPNLALRPELNAVFRTRAIGEDIVLGRIPASAVAFVADSTRKALKTVLDYVFSVKTEGRPRDDHRLMYDLPIQSFAFASFELSFAAPDEGLLTQQDVRQAAEKLEKGLAWASGDEGADIASEPEEREVILRAALLLTPPSSGPIQEVRVSGTWVTRSEIILTREARRKVADELKDFSTERDALYIGRLGELDVDKFSFTLRDMPGGSERRCNFAEEIVTSMMALINQEIVVAGTEVKGKFTAFAVIDRDTALSLLAKNQETLSPSDHN